jgi:hypothetical protein
VPDAELHVFYGFNVLDRVAVTNPQLAAFKGAILAKAAELGGEDGGVFLRGRVGQVELAREMQQARVLAYPTAFLETSCITAMEAKAAGLPIVTSHLGALVASIIFEVEAELDGYAAAAGYSVPVSTAATYAFGTMQLQTKNGAGARVLGILFPNMGGPGGKATLATDYQTAYMTFVRSLRDGKVALVGAGLSGGEEARALPRAGAAASQTVPFDWTP